jgi:cellulose synthase/poly-beta-1,6-N-acetylglucosamine synthase-like glycosyltransferase
MSLAWMLIFCGIEGCLLGGFLYWLASIFAFVRVRRAVPNLNALYPPAPPRWHSLSVIIPACNEAETLEEAISSKLKDDYPDAEFILVDDRSVDKTPEIADRLAAHDARVRVLHIRELPEGWLGKVHALQKGFEISRGEWILISDADVHFTPGTLRRAIAWCEEGGIDHLAVIPQMLSAGFLLDAVVTMFVRVICLGGMLWKVKDAKSKRAAGAGAFSLFRRSALKRTPGFEWLRLEVVDDFALGQMLKNHGARAAIVNGRDCVTVHFYPTLGAMAQGMEKNTFAAMGQYSIPRLVTFTMLFLFLELSPFLALMPFWDWWLRLLAPIMTALALALSVSVACWAGNPVIPSLFTLLGTPIFALFCLRSGWLAWRRGGIMWRGTLYPTKDLRAGSRLILP